MLPRSSIIKCILSLIIAIYLGFALHGTAESAADTPYRDLIIRIDDSATTDFVDAADISRECGNLGHIISSVPRCSIDVDAIERRLNQNDKIESANVSTTCSDRLVIDVCPMVPVARVFDNNGSYYINTDGKRISADIRYHIDVPVVTGYFNDRYPASRLLPLLSHIAADADLDALVSTVYQQPDGDIIIVPAIRGHVINFGDTSAMDDKFARLHSFYRNVMPVRGWQTYDTIAVKWAGRVVATRRNKHLDNSILALAPEDHDDYADDHDTMADPTISD